MTLWADSADDKLMIFFYLALKIGFDISCKLSPQFAWNVKTYFFFFWGGGGGGGKLRKYFKMSSAEIITQHAER